MIDDKHDTDPAPPTAPDHEAPEPSLRQVLCRVEEVRALFAALLARVEALGGGVGRVEAALDRMIADAALLRVEEHRHGGALAELRADLDAGLDGLPCRSGGNGATPPGCPEAAE